MGQMEDMGRHMGTARVQAIHLVRDILEPLPRMSLLSTSTQGQSKATHSPQGKTLSLPVLSVIPTHLPLVKFQAITIIPTCMMEIIRNTPGLLPVMVHPTKMTTLQLRSPENSSPMKPNYRPTVDSMTLTRKAISRVSKICSRMINTAKTSECQIFKMIS
jgi:hypothetical protein